jgi:hypothetical protein
VGAMSLSVGRLAAPHPAMPIESFPDWGMVLSRRLVFAECPFFIRPFKIRWWEFVPTSLFSCAAAFTSALHPRASSTSNDPGGSPSRHYLAAPERGDDSTRVSEQRDHHAELQSPSHSTPVWPFHQSAHPRLS